MLPSFQAQIQVNQPQAPGLCLFSESGLNANQVSEPDPSLAEKYARALEALAQARQSVFEVDFSELAKKWKSERRSTSFSSVIAMHPAYQRIIGMGKEAVPLILRDIENEPDHWFWALRAITGEDPVSSEIRGDMQKMADAWVKWGREKGYAW
jgi:hypothetical protein